MRIELSVDQVGNQACAREIDNCVHAEIHEDELKAFLIKEGDILMMNDHEELVEVTVVDTAPFITVMDKQGFYHQCEREMYCTCSKTIILKSLTSSESKKKQGYDVKVQKKISWDVWHQFFATARLRAAAYS